LKQSLFLPISTQNAYNTNYLNGKGEKSLIVVNVSAVAHGMSKPVICPKCKRGILGHIAEESEAAISKRGRPPPDKQGDYVQVKCFICRSLWALTIEN